MYHCHLRIYLIGCQPGTIEVIKAVPPLEQFSHTFSESARPDGALADQADLILADVRALDPADAEAVLALGGGASCWRTGSRSRPLRTDWTASGTSGRRP